jgi:restriction system protein
MARHNRQHLLRELATLPWWIGLGLAIIVYVALKWVFPAVVGRSVFLKGIAEAVGNNAALLATPFLVVTLVAAFNAFRRRKLLDDQTGLNSLNAMSWQDFELLVGEAFRRQGFVIEESGGAAPDGGIDLLLYRSGKKTVVQCKRWKNAQVGVAQIRELYGVMVAERADRCIFVSSGTFTADAIAFAQGKPIELLNGSGLADLIKGLQPAGKTAAPHRLAAIGVPVCPTCGASMVRRVAKRGAQAGGEFWGCARFPSCRGTRGL